MHNQRAAERATRHLDLDTNKGMKMCGLNRFNTVITKSTCVSEFVSSSLPLVFSMYGNMLETATKATKAVIVKITLNKNYSSRLK